MSNHSEMKFHGEPVVYYGNETEKIQDAVDAMKLSVSSSAPIYGYISAGKEIDLGLVQDLKAQFPSESGEQINGVVSYLMKFADRSESSEVSKVKTVSIVALDNSLWADELEKFSIMVDMSLDSLSKDGTTVIDGSGYYEIRSNKGNKVVDNKDMHMIKTYLESRETKKDSFEGTPSIGASGGSGASSVPKHYGTSPVKTFTATIEAKEEEEVKSGVSGSWFDTTIEW